MGFRRVFECVAFAMQLQCNHLNTSTADSSALELNNLKVREQMVHEIPPRRTVVMIVDQLCQLLGTLELYV